MLGAVLTTIGGGDYPPRGERVARLYREWAAAVAQDRSPQDRTLGGCLILSRRGPRRERDKILICREPAVVEASRQLAPGENTRWDGRFRVTLDPAAPAGLALGALGADTPAIARDPLFAQEGGKSAFAQEGGKSAALRLPSLVRATQPALRDAKGVVAVPTLGYFKCCRREAETEACLIEFGPSQFCRVEFRPIRSLTGAGFTIV